MWLELQLHAFSRGLTSDLGRLPRGIELIVLDLRGERLAVGGKGDPFDEHAPTRRTPAAAFAISLNAAGAFVT